MGVAGTSRLLAACTAAVMAFATMPGAAQQKVNLKVRPKVEKLACGLGTDDHQARIAVELIDGKVNRFAYYSKWKPRTCSMEVARGDAFSLWADQGPFTTILMAEEKGIFLIDHGDGRYHFTFGDVDRIRFCGMEGKINGYVTIWKGSSRCMLEGVMDVETAGE